MGVKTNELTKGRIFSAVIFILMLTTFFIFLSGKWFWIEGWIFSIWLIVIYLSISIYLHSKDTELLAERLRKPGTGNEKNWDKYIVYALVILFLGWFLISPLDIRYVWTTGFPLWLKILGGILLIPSFFFIYRSYTDNTFLSPLVRIQDERKQYLVSTGVYGFVRHPMYLGGILMVIGVPMMLGSKYGIVMGAIMSFIIAARIIGEEKMLMVELEGYGDYKRRVKNRLVPFLW